MTLAGDATIIDMELLMKKLQSIVISALMLVAMTTTTVALAETTKSHQTQTIAVTQKTTEATVNINTADAQTLMEKLNGIGMKKAQAIVSFREENGPFKTVDDLMKVKGIGQATLDKNRSLLSVN